MTVNIGVYPLGCLWSAPLNLTNTVYTLRQPPGLSLAAPHLVECHLWVVLISNQTNMAASYKNSALKCVSEDKKSAAESVFIST